MSMKNSIDTIGNQTPDLLACSAVPQPTVPPACPNTSKKAALTPQWLPAENEAFAEDYN